MKFDRDSSIKRGGGVGEPKPAAQGARARRAEGESEERERGLYGEAKREEKWITVKVTPDAMI